MKQTTALLWLRAMLAVAGAFFVAGICGAFVAGRLNLWATPIAGAVAAFAVVSSAYLFAPSHRRRSAVVVFVVGAAAAWYFVGNSWYPESYREQAYLRSHAPFACTLAGGLVGVLFALISHRRALHGHGA